MRKQLASSTRPWSSRVHCVLLLLSLSVLGGGCERRPGLSGALEFCDLDAPAKKLSLANLTEHLELGTVETEDPYYRERKRFLALPVIATLAYAFGKEPAVLRGSTFQLVALDGYAVTMSGEQLMVPEAYFALDDAEVPGFAPIGPRKVSPKPAYLIWRGDEHPSLETHPRPWQLSSIRIVDRARLYPHTVPQGELAGSDAMLGHQLFQERCLRCHAINREGGRVGPDLNVPQSIVEYRPEAQIRAYILNPQTFRYGTMPKHDDLSETDLTHLLAYFHVMAKHKHDPDASDHHE